MTGSAAREFDQLRARRVIEWRLEFDSDGARFVWAGCAGSREAAENTARADLAQDQAAFNASTARLVACHQR